MIDQSQNTHDHPYSDWMSKIYQAANVEPVDKHKKKHEEPTSETNNKINSYIWGFILFSISFIVRILFIFYFTDAQNAGAGWYNDSYHHWQIAYLTKEIGLSHGFLRLWDLIGMEYFWGLLQPFLLVILFTITGSADIILMRLFNTILGSLTVVLIFAIVKKHFSWHAAVGASLLAILNPIGIFTDTSGMQEPLAIFLMLSGVYLWPAMPLQAGLAWLLASMARSEYWLFSLGLFAAILIFDKNHHKKAQMIFPYIGGIFLYMKYLLDKSGNAIYPLYWNFIGNAAGEWQADIPLTAQQEAIKIVFLVILVFSINVVIYLIIKKPKLYIFSLLGVGNLIFLSVFIGFTDYLKSYLPRFWVDRIFLLPYIWLGAVLAILLLHLLPKKTGIFGRITGWIGLILIALTIQIAWVPINHYKQGGDFYLTEQRKIASEIVGNYNGGSLLIPGNDPILTYQLYKEGIEGKNIRGQMFDPYYYFTDIDPYSKWGKNRKIVFKWLKDENIKTVVFSNELNNRYLKLVEKEPDSFVEKPISNKQYRVFEYIPQNNP